MIFRRNDQVRYIGDNAHYGFVGTVRAIEEMLDGEVRIDVCFSLGSKRCGFRRLVAPENLEKVETTAAKAA